MRYSYLIYLCVKRDACIYFLRVLLANVRAVMIYKGFVSASKSQLCCLGWIHKESTNIIVLNFEGEVMINERLFTSSQVL